MTDDEKKTLKRLIEERKTEEWIFSKDNDMLMKIKTDIRWNQRSTEAWWSLSLFIRLAR